MELTHVRPERDLKTLAQSSRSEEVKLDPPPVTPRKPPASLFQRVGPVFLVVAVIGMVVMGYKSGRLFSGAGMMFPLMMVTGAMMMFANRGGQKKGEVEKDRADYMRYVDVQRRVAIEAEAAQFAAAQFHYPGSGELALRIGSDRMWERRPGEAQFGHVRVGVGVQESARRFGPVPIGALEDQEPACVQAVSDLVAEHSFVRDIARPVSLLSAPSWALAGDVEAARAAARAMVVQLAFFHGPDDLLIAVLADRDAAADWDWVKWLPHARFGAGRTVLTADTAAGLVSLLGVEFSDRGRFADASRVKPSALQTAAGTPSTPAMTGHHHLFVVCDAAFVDWDVFVGDGAGREAVTVLDIGARGPLATPSTTLTYQEGTVLMADGGAVQ